MYADIMVFKFITLLSIFHLVLSLPDPGVYLELKVDKDADPNVHLVLDVDYEGENENADVTGTITSPELASPEDKSTVTIELDCDEEEGFFPLPDTQRCYKLFDDVDVTWYQAKKTCYEGGLIMATTTDDQALGLRELLVNLFGDDRAYAWLDARFNGYLFEWNDGEIIANDNSLWYPGRNELKPDYCLVLLNSQRFIDEQPSKAYWSGPCLQTDARKALCEKPY